MAVVMLDYRQNAVFLREDGTLNLTTCGYFETFPLIAQLSIGLPCVKVFINIIVAFVPADNLIVRAEPLPGSNTLLQRFWNGISGKFCTP